MKAKCRLAGLVGVLLVPVTIPLYLISLGVVSINIALTYKNKELAMDLLTGSINAGLVAVKTVINMVVYGTLIPTTK